MDNICDYEKCTGCGMCSNICNQHAIKMEKGEHGFIFPIIDKHKCVDCGICRNACPANTTFEKKENVRAVYAAWSKDENIRKASSSGGVFSVLAKYFIEHDGAVCGVAWDEKFHPKHIMVDDIDELYRLRGSKYSQSITGDIFLRVKEALSKGKPVLFSGTPCQIDALNNYLGRKYENLLLVDLVCHGVPSNEMLDRYYSGFSNEIKDVKLRMKDPYWDYSYVCIEFNDGDKYQELTIDDPYFNLFNIGYSLRPSCHKCQYANSHRHSDVTIADFWGYKATGFRTIDYNKGVSLILVNSKRGGEIINDIKGAMICEESSLELAKRRNRCLSKPFEIDKKLLDLFWNDYEDGIDISDLNDKYCKKIKLPNLLFFRRIYNKWKWLIKL